MMYHDVLGDLPETPVGHDFDVSRATESFIPTARAVTFHPIAFFTSLPRQGNYWSPLAFALICAEISTILGGILGLVGGSSIAAFLGSIVGTIIGATIGLFVVAGIAHLLARAIVGATTSPFEATFRVAAYASVTSLASWIPLVGGLAGLYGLYLAIVGMREVHQTTTGKAAAIVLIPVAAIIVLAIVAGVVVGLAALAGLGGVH